MIFEKGGGSGKITIHIILGITSEYSLSRDILRQKRNCMESKKNKVEVFTFGSSWVEAGHRSVNTL